MFYVSLGEPMKTQWGEPLTKPHIIYKINKKKKTQDQSICRLRVVWPPQAGKRVWLSHPANLFFVPFYI
jgi:hypothetical protein